MVKGDLTNSRDEEEVLIGINEFLYPIYGCVSVCESCTEYVESNI